MLPAYNSAVSGMQTAQQTLDIVANNVANSATPGFDATQADVTDLVYQSVDPRAMLGPGATTPLGVGAQLAGTSRSLVPGAPISTNNPLDVSIQGNGYLQIQLDTGQTGYTRAGMIRTDAQGRLSIENHLLVPPVVMPAGSSDPEILNDGTVMAMTPNGRQPVGQIQLARFPNEQGLQAIDGTVYLPTATSGAPLTANPGQNGMGTLQNGTLEGARVDFSREMSTLIIAERAYGLNSRALQALDRMVGDVTKH